MSPHKGMLFVDQGDDDNWYVSNIVTLEAKQLPLGVKWEIQFHPTTGFAAAINLTPDAKGDHQLVDLDEFMDRRLLYSATSGERFLQNRAAKCGHGGLVSLDDLLLKHGLCDLKVSIGGSNAVIAWKGFAFGHCRPCKSQLYWSLFSLYPALGLTCYQNQPSQWVHRRKKAWGKLTERLYGPGQFVFSNFITAKTEAKSKLAFSERCLPDPSVSTAGLLLILSQAAFQDRQHGGLADNEHAETALLIFKAFLDQYVGKESKELVVLNDEKWRPCWPRPNTETSHGARSFQLSITASCLVDLTAFRTLASELLARSAVSKWWKWMGEGLAMEPFVLGWRAFFARLQKGNVVCAGLLSQVIHIMSRALTTDLGRQCDTGGHRATDTISCTRPDLEGALGNQHAVNRYLARYVLNTSMVGSGQRQFGVCTDEGDVQALKLHVTAFILPTNHCIVATPQVAPKSPCSLNLCGGVVVPTSL